jgi:hypothetical protein
MPVGSSPSEGSLESSQRKLARSNIHASAAVLRQKRPFNIDHDEAAERDHSTAAPARIARALPLWILV